MLSMMYGALTSILEAAGMVKIKIIFWSESGSHKMRTFMAVLPSNSLLPCLCSRGRVKMTGVIKF